MTQCAAGDQVIDGKTSAYELLNRKSGRQSHNGWNHCGNAASVWKVRVHQRIVFVQPFPEMIGDHLETRPKSAGVELNVRFLR